MTMRKWTRSRQLPCDAIDWWVENTADQEPDQEQRSRWKAWSSSRRNQEEYAAVVRLLREIRRLPPPVPAQRHELLEDAAAEPHTLDSFAVSDS
jgi:ferric-dicitrate binding protein FerR (iron transport regulator)